MKRFVSSFLTLSLILSPILYGQDAKKDGGKDSKEQQLPKSVQEILTKTEKDALNLRTTYEEGLLKIFQASEKKMQDEQTKLTKAGDLEGAMMVKEKIATFKKEISEKMNEKGRDNLLAEDGKKDGGKNTTENIFVILQKNEVITNYPGPNQPTVTFRPNGILNTKWDSENNKFSWKQDTKNSVITTLNGKEIWKICFNLSDMTIIAISSNKNTETISGKILDIKPIK